MLNKIRYILVFVSLSICLGLMSGTYSRYVADTKGNIDVLFAQWQILVNNTDITSNTNSTITFMPVIEDNEYVANNKVAPSSKGYFDINIDPTNVDVSFRYSINLEIDNEDIPDLMITKYAIIPDNYVEGDTLELINLDGSVITDTFNYNKEIESFGFETFTIRVFFEWYDGEDDLMSDEDDTRFGTLSETEDNTFQMKANISFEQIFE